MNAHKLFVPWELSFFIATLNHFQMLIFPFLNPARFLLSIFICMTQHLIIHFSQKLNKHTLFKALVYANAQARSFCKKRKSMSILLLGHSCSSFKTGHFGIFLSVPIYLWLL